MIPADRFSMDSNTAWWSMPDLMGILTDFGKPPLERPCDVCGDLLVHGGYRMACCGATGRHTFDIEVECTGSLEPNGHGGLSCNGGCGQAPPYGVLTYRAAIIPGHVLRVAADVGPVLPGRHVRVTGGGIAWLAEPIDGGGWKHTEIVLPPATEVDDWAIGLWVR